MAEESKPVVGNELSAAFVIPAPLINRFYVTATGPVFRITFGEQETSPDPQGQADAPVHMRSAVSMTVENIVQLRDLLSLMAAQFQAANPEDVPNV